MSIPSPLLVLAIILPGLVLLGLKLPNVGGLEVLQRICGDARTKELPLVVLTSSDEFLDLDESRRLGADSYRPSGRRAGIVVNFLHLRCPTFAPGSPLTCWK